MLLKDLTGEQVLAAPEFETEIAGLSADSRTVSNDFLFAALKGAQVDGTRFIADARAAGAAALLVGADTPAVALGDLADLPPVIVSDDPRRSLALMAARFHPGQPDTTVAVTGTSGKTSVAVFARQIFAAAGHVSASLGTIGTVTSRGAEYGGLTTPDPVSLHETLAHLAADGVTHAAMEASSHGLDQRRLDGVRLSAAAFTNLGRDHLDYHPEMEAYLAAKMRLFDTLLGADRPVVLEPEAPYADRVMAAARARGQPVFTVGGGGADLGLVDLRHDGFAQVLTLETDEGRREVRLPLAGRFQVSNALVAAGLALSVGLALDTVLEALEALEGAPGRLECVGESDDGALVFVDYAHKPEALESALAALRPFTQGRLIVVFGAGGDRDPGKRALMGEVAARQADVVIVTDDNPRHEDPAVIRAAILEGAPAALEIGERRDAIEAAVGMLQAGDVLCIAGKGHEPGQIVGDDVLPFSDHDVARGALAAIAESDLFAAASDSGADFDLDLAAVLDRDLGTGADEEGQDAAPAQDDPATAADRPLEADLDLAAFEDMLLGEPEAPAAPGAMPAAESADAAEAVEAATSVAPTGAGDAEDLETTQADAWPDGEGPGSEAETGSGSGLDLDLDLEALLEAPLETDEAQSEPSEGPQEGADQDDAFHADAADLLSPESASGEGDATPEAPEAWDALEDAVAADTADAGSERSGSEDTYGEGALFEEEGAEVDGAEEAGTVEEGADDIAPQDIAPQDVAPQDAAPEDAAPEDIAPEESVSADADHPSQDTAAAAALVAGAAVASALATPARAPVGGAVPGATPLPEWEEPDPDRPLWTVAEMAEATGGSVEGIDDPDTAVVGLSIDSRTMVAGEAFIAIVGDRFDGHSFVVAALDAGAALAVVARDKRADLPADGRYLLVADPLEALRDLARAARARSRARIVAVTGSVGKTGTKEMLKLALDASGRTHAAVASFNNHWGVPLTLARLPVQAKFGVFEIGMNHAGEITPLVQMVRPHVAIITTVEAVHLENFGSVERIAQAKAEIFLGLEPGGLALLNRDNRQFDLLTYLAKTAGVRRIATFGREGAADVEAERVSAQVGCTSISGHIFDREITYKVGAPGRHLVTNSLAVLAAVVELGGDLARGALALGEFHAPKGRGAQVTLRLPEGEATVIDESYNANPASMRAALSLLKETPVARPGRRIAVLGDMLELGESEARLHGELLGPVQQGDVDLVYCAGRRMRALWDDLPKHLRGAYAEEAESLRPLLLDDIRPGDVMMIKGSLGSRMGPLVEALRDEYPVGDDGSR